MKVTAADLVQMDERTSTRQVIEPDLPQDCLDELTQQLANDVATILPGKLMGWGREATVMDANGHYYHVDLDYA